mgnify:CR=1 FL=1
MFQELTSSSESETSRKINALKQTIILNMILFSIRFDMFASFGLSKPRLTQDSFSLSTMASHFFGTKIMAAANIAAIIPGALKPEYIHSNVESYQQEIPTDLWAELKSEGLLREDAPTSA